MLVSLAKVCGLEKSVPLIMYECDTSCLCFALNSFFFYKKHNHLALFSCDHNTCLWSHILSVCSKCILNQSCRQCVSSSASTGRCWVTTWLWINCWDLICPWGGKTTVLPPKSNDNEEIKWPAVDIFSLWLIDETWWVIIRPWLPVVAVWDWPTSERRSSSELSWSRELQSKMERYW